jgi:photosystem II stability/assembly factor-like uncharacterized protein
MPARRTRPFLALLALLLLVPATPPAWAAAPADDEEADHPVDPALFQGMKWRSIGPYRGGRATAVTGVPGEPFTYYFGATGGGVWKTTDGGTTWKNVSDGHFETGSVGALAVAPSDPNVVYAGMGEAPIRGVTTSHGDGVYRTTDAGRTWTHLGLEGTEHISMVAVHPSDPDRAWVAAQGSAWQPTEERGVYRTKDGGATWERVLFVSDSAGASDLSMDATNPRVLYAAFWDHDREPWLVRSGGPGSGIWKTTDGGDTWKEIGRGETEDGEEGGLPETMGKTAVAVSPADPDRVWVLVEADDGGLFRSDDGGKTFRKVNGERVLRARAWYYIHLFADPQDADTVYVLNAPFMKSIDGGKTFTPIRTPHGDNHHLWIHPGNNRWMINANDGGANVSFNGGETWSTQANQPTAQFYRVDVDRGFPYRIYGGQQDNSTVSIPSAALGGIEEGDWYPVGGCESAHVAFDPDDPRYVYAGCYQGIITEWDREIRNDRTVMAVPFLGLGAQPKDLPYRFNWNAPIEVSPHDPSVIYHAGNVLLRSTDRGRTWTEVSPDLTRDEEEKQGKGGAPITSEGAGGETYNTIFYIALSPHEEGTIWAGTDDGLVHLTRDGGETWEEVTPGGIGEAQINAIEVSPHDPAKAYVAVTRYKLGDYRPYAFKTGDYGATWTAIAGGIPEGAGAWMRVVREDPERPGLLYAGTETGAWLSFDDGTRWQPLELGLPVVPVTDLAVADGDLVAATQGRSFWVLDDLSPLRQVAAAREEVAGAELHLFQPTPAVRVGWGGGFGQAEGQNPPLGVTIDYVLSEDLAESLTGPGKSDAEEDEEGLKRPVSVPAGEGGGNEADEPEKPTLELDILDAGGRVLRSYSSKPEKGGGGPGGGGPGGGGGGSATLPAKAGMNRFVWPFQEEGVIEVPGLFGFGDAQPVVPPGTYRVRLTAGEHEATREVEVVEDPRIDTTTAEYAETQALLADIRAALNELHDSVLRARTVKAQVEAEVERAEDLEGNEEGAEAIAEAGGELAKALKEWEDSVVQTKSQTFQDVVNFPNLLNAQLAFLFDAVDDGPPNTEGALTRWGTLESQWQERKAALQTILDADVAAFNALVAEHQVPAVVVPLAGKHLEDEEGED